MLASQAPEDPTIPVTAAQALAGAADAVSPMAGARGGASGGIRGGGGAIGSGGGDIGGGNPVAPQTPTTTTPPVPPISPISPISPVPEPSSWALLLVAFGALGARLRLRRTSADRRAGVEQSAR